MRRMTWRAASVGLYPAVTRAVTGEPGPLSVTLISKP